VRGEPIAVSGIIAVPKTDKPEGGYPIVTWCHGTVAAADNYAPSRDFEGSDTSKFHRFVHPLLNEFLNKGYAVLMTDYEGLGTKPLHPYMLGESEARGALDIILAARQLHPGVFSNRFAIVGHSQGGQAALFTAHHYTHTPGWKDSLELVGVAALAPASAVRFLVSLSTGQLLLLPGEPPEPIQALIQRAAPNSSFGANEIQKPITGQAFTALFIAGAIGGDNTIVLEDVLQDEALRRFQHTYELSRTGLSGIDSWGGLNPGQQLRLTSSESKTKLIQQFNKMHPALEISVPIRISQGNHDSRVNPILTSELVDQLNFINPSNQIKEYRLFDVDDAGDDLGHHFGLLTSDHNEVVEWVHDLLKV